MGEELSMDFVQGLNVKDPPRHVQSGLPNSNLQTTFEEESKDRPVDGEVQDYNSSQQAQNPDSGVHQIANSANAESFPKTVLAQQKLDHGPQKTVVGKSPQLSTGTQRAIEKVLKESLRKMGIVPQFHQDNKPENSAENLLQSTAMNRADSNAGNTHFSFSDLGAGSASNSKQNEIFVTAQWRLKEPPAYTGAASDAVYVWTSLVRQYFVSMQGSPQQEVDFAANFLRSTAHEWYLRYEKRNGNRPPRDWPTFQQALLDRFGSNIRAQEAQSRLMNISQGKRAVREYTSEFETLIGRMTTQDEATWLNVYIWGLQTTSGESRGSQIPAYHCSGVGSC